MSDRLKELRAQIDALDVDILKLINQRAACAHEIGQIKQGAFYRPEREAQVLRRIKDLNAGPLTSEAAARLFREIMSACLALEKRLSVAYLGPAGTFSEAAAVKQFGHAAQTMACGSIDEVFRITEAGTTDYCVVPVENSTEGAVNRTLDLLTQTHLRICGEVVLRIHHHLLAKTADLPFASIKRVYSHSQSLAQCHEWLNLQLPGVQRIPTFSNAEAARIAASEEGSVAVAGEMAAERYGLHLLAQNIEDESNNTTRFLVLGSHETGRSGKDKTSLVMSAKNVPGAVHELLSPLARHGVSMTKFESRPSRTELWEYVFFVDIEGHIEDDVIATTITELKEKTAFLKVLGSYPVAVL
ncbi:MAG TPA: prephenate dehydratase [Burkholderiales bacterium]|nr:prephenate dehydratase [Burkholderiales bacterium]